MTQEIDFADIDTLLNASMDDLDDLPPVGAPPSGHYNLTTTFSLEEVGDDKRQVIFAKYVVDAINELKNEDEASEVQVGQEFREGFYVTKKNGERNTFGIGTLKERLAPHSVQRGIVNIGELINEVKQVQIAATVKRTVNKKDPDNYNLSLKDIIIL
jgi:hypothetical protein